MAEDIHDEVEEEKEILKTNAWKRFAAIAALSAMLIGILISTTLNVSLLVTTSPIHIAKSQN